MEKILPSPNILLCRKSAETLNIVPIAPFQQRCKLYERNLKNDCTNTKALLKKLPANIPCKANGKIRKLKRDEKLIVGEKKLAVKRKNDRSGE